MKKSDSNRRRSFLKNISGTALVAGTVPNLMFGNSSVKTYETLRRPFKSYSANDNIQLATIGMGIQGFNDTRAALATPGVKLVAACDLYQGRQKSTKEVFGKDVFTTNDYKEILRRDDVDAVIIATPDHWHDRISMDAMDQGKAVYCEKPMVHNIEEGWAVIENQQKNDQVFQVGSQRVSSLVYEKAKELYEAGAIGQLVLIETWNDRQSNLGAWNYSIPLDASPDTIDWDRFLGDAPKVGFDPKRFFRWRNYQDYGTGVAGDLFIHLFSGIHFITGSSGPSKIYTTGGLRYWKDGRDVPDVMIGCYDYPKNENHPAFNIQVRVNFIDGGGGGGRIRLVGSEGVMTVGDSAVRVTKSKMSNQPGYDGWDSFDTFDEANKEEFEKWYASKYPAPPPKVKENGEQEFRIDGTYSDHIDHFANFFESIRTGSTVVEDAVFGFRAAAAALGANKSFFEQKIIQWDPVAMQFA
ncbi:Gfo/Idh/MocA family protein [Flagellimonas lutimaris]|uniref:Gfo/Idh/MocA family protein n=1 Tax=Flagellimonas lutimaris TaxID=475082 RepID=UPI003F5CEF0A